jgi:lipopolysaccharide biosynthesis regulator YciM
MKLHETERDWSEALRAYDDLPAPLRAERGKQAAQYLCELTEQALVEGDVARVDALLQQALRHDSRCARAAFLRARRGTRRCLRRGGRALHRRDCGLARPARRGFAAPA